MHYLSFGEPGTKRCLYKTEAAGRKDWTVYRATLLAEFGRRPWAFWVFDMEMDRPLSVSDGVHQPKRRAEDALSNRSALKSVGEPFC
jgi:hypothetical protein